MDNFWDYNVWDWILVFGVLLGSLLVGNMLKKGIRPLRNSLIPTSVLGGCILLIVAAVYKWITGDVMLDTAIFGENGTAKMEMITYHTLALGFIASADCQASATPKNASKGESQPKHFFGLKLIDKTIFCKVSLSKE